VLSATWLLKTVAFVAIAAGVSGTILGPGIRGNAGETVVSWTDIATATLSFFLAALLLALLAWGAIELLKAVVPVEVRAGLVAGDAALVALLLPWLRERLPPQSVVLVTVLIAAAAAVAALAGGYFAARGPHTRSIAGVLFALAFAAIVRLAAWGLATRASDTANLPLFRLSMYLATAGVLLEASGQLVAVLWLTTRSRAFGQLGSVAALVGSVVLMLGVPNGGHSGAPVWQAILHTALADAPGIPPPWSRLDALATCLVPSSLLLALAVAAQPRQVGAVVATLALALVSRGTFDEPLRALCVVVAAQWAVLACVDEKAMWRTLLADRKQRLAEEGIVEPASSPSRVSAAPPVPPADTPEA
jgi:hypothetical protein